MDQEQQPGNVYTPGGGQQNQDVTEGQSGNQEASRPRQAATNDEIAAIDDAVQNADPPPSETPADPVAEPQHEQARMSSTEENQIPSDQLSDQESLQVQPDVTTGAKDSMPPDQSEQEQLQNQETHSNPETPLLAWEAAEPTEARTHTMRAMLGIILVAILVAGAVVALNGLNFSTIMSVIVIVLAIVAVTVSSQQHSHLESYAIYDTGVAIGERFYAFSNMRAFSIVSFGEAASIELEPTQRFMVRRIMHLDNGTAEQAVELLGQQLPYEERSQSTVDRLSNKLNL